MTSSNNIDTEQRLKLKEVPGYGVVVSSKDLENIVAADRNKLIKHLAFQLGEDEEHLTKLVEMLK